jgi:hypothetical protein
MWTPLPTKANKNNYKWETIPSVEALGELRMTAMKDFLADFPGGKEEGRNLAHSMPNLPFQNRQFDIALCSHYSNNSIVLNLEHPWNFPPDLVVPTSCTYPLLSSAPR